MFNITKRFSTVVALATGLAMGTVSMSAFAAFAEGSPSQVEYPGGVNGLAYLVLQQGGANYEAQLVSPGCSLPGQSIDTLKAWQGLATSALLSGKSVRIYFNDCNSRHWIADVVLKQ